MISSLTNIDGTPSSLGTVGQVLAVDATASAVEYVSLSSSATASLDGDFSTGTLTVTKVQGQVTLDFDSATHTSGTSAASTATLVPVGYRPARDITCTYFVDGTDVRVVTISAGGQITVSYYDWAGSGATRTTSGNVSVTYRVV